MPVMLQAPDENTLCNTSSTHTAFHFFFPFPFVLGETPLDATLLAREVWAVVDLLPFLTASSCLFYHWVLEVARPVQVGMLYLQTILCLLLGRCQFFFNLFLLLFPCPSFAVAVG